METKKEFEKKCPVPGHQANSIIAICTKESCVNPTICCAKCIAFSHSTCGDELLFIEDVLGKSNENLFTMKQFSGMSDVKAENSAKTVSLEEFKKIYFMAIEKELQNISKKFMWFLNSSKRANWK